MARRVEATSLAPGDSVTLAADDVERIMGITIRVRDNGRVIRLTDPVYCRIHQEGDDRWIVEFEDADDFDFDEPSLLISLGSTGRRPTSPTPRRHANPPQAPTRT